MAITSESSTFNESGNWTYDVIVLMSDYSAADVQNINRYQELKLKETLTTAEETELTNLLSDSGGGVQHFVITASDWNKMASCIMYLEQFFKENTLGVVTQCKTDLNNIIGQMNEVYDYSPSQQYKAPMLVQYTDNNETNIYFCKLTPPTTGILPTNTTYFVKLSLKGEKGDAGANLVWGGKWLPDTTYTMNNLVYYNTGMYVSLKDNNKGNYPDVTGSTYWQFWQYQVPDKSITLAKLSDEVITKIDNSNVMVDSDTAISYMFVMKNGVLGIKEL